jgi:hypothetical protein
LQERSPLRRYAPELGVLTGLIAALVAVLAFVFDVVSSDGNGGAGTPNAIPTPIVSQSEDPPQRPQTPASAVWARTFLFDDDSQEWRSAVVAGEAQTLFVALEIQNKSATSRLDDISVKMEVGEPSASAVSLTFIVEARDSFVEAPALVVPASQQLSQVTFVPESLGARLWTAESPDAEPTPVIDDTRILTDGLRLGSRFSLCTGQIKCVLFLSLKVRLDSYYQ